MLQEQTIQEVAKALGITIKEDLFSVNRQLLAIKINELINTNFQKLVSILYRMDISEAKLKLLLHDHPNEDAGVLIADMMIEREAQKIKSRQQFRQRDNTIDESEKW
jgi:hypothetical protein